MPTTNSCTCLLTLNEIETKLSEDLASLKSWFDNNEFVINLKKGKTETMIFGTSNRLNKQKNLQTSYWSVKPIKNNPRLNLLCNCGNDLQNNDNANFWVLRIDLPGPFSVIQKLS